MNNPFLTLRLLILIFITAGGTTLVAQENAPRVVDIHGKRFLSLAPEPAPENLFWGQFGSVVESYYGVTAYSNGARRRGRIYQCTELVHRFITEIYGIPSRLNLGMGHGKDLAKNLAAYHRTVVGTSDTLNGYTVRLENFENAKSVYPPLTGSIVSMYFDSRKKGYGHVGIIRDMKINENGQLEATLFDQHGFAHIVSGIPIQADRLFFEKDEKGCWSGYVHSWKNNRQYPVISWTNPVVVEDTVALDGECE